jgi:hypothetical protein
MADLTGVNDTLPTRIGGVSSSSGLPDFYADVTAAGQLLVKDASDGPVTPGTVASFSQLAGGQYNSSAPTLTTGQQAAFQLTSSGALIVSATLPYDTNYGTVGATTLRVASQIGNATGAASFGAGATGAQTLRVAANTYDGFGNAITSASNGYAAQQLLSVQVPNTTVAPVALGALNATISIAMAGLQTVGFQMAAGTFIGTIAPQYSIDGGTSWLTCSFLNASTGNITSSFTFTSSNTLTILGIIPGGGATNVRVIVTAYTSGTASCILSATQTLSTTSQSGSIQGSGTIAALNQTVVASTAGYGSSFFNITGTWVGTITFQAHNGDFNWGNIYVYLAATGSYASSSTTVNTTVQLNCAGYVQVRAIATAWTSGTATLSWDSAAYPHQLQIYNPNSAANLLTTAYTVDGNGNIIGSTAQTGASLYTVKPDASVTGTLGALNATLNIPINDVSSAYALISGTWVGTIQFQGSVNGSTFVPLQAVQGGTLNAYTTAGFTANGGVRIALPAGFTSIQAVMTAYTSGTATVVINTSAALANVEIVQFNASNLNVLGNGTVTTNAPTYTTGTNAALSLKTTGELRVNDASAITYLSQIATNTAAAATDFTTIGTITALNGTVSVYGQGVYTVTASITGTWVGTLVIEGQAADNNWYGLDIYTPSNNVTPFATTITTNGLYAVVGGGFLNIRVRASAYTSGTVNVALDGSLAQQSILAGQLGTWTVTATQSTAANLKVQAQGAAASGSAVTGNPVLIGASDGTNAQTLQVNPVNNGVESLLVQNNENLRQTYSIGVGGSTFPAIAGAPTDVFILNGSATKTVRIINIQFSMTATTAVLVPVQLIKRSTVNGASASSGSATATPHDSNNAAATATNIFYVANPSTLGTQVGSIIRDASYLATTATTDQQQVLSWSFGQDGGQPIVLRGTVQGLAINLNGVTIAGGKINITVTWTEDNT